MPLPLTKFGTYLREARFAMSSTASITEGIRLTKDTLRFHVDNYMGGSVQHAPSSKTYRFSSDRLPSTLRLRQRTGDYFVLYEIFLDQCYWVPPLLRRHISSVVDLGANIGLTTLYLQSLSLHPGCRYVCVEPDPKNASLMRMNLSELSATHPVDIVEAAISDRAGSGLFSTGQTWGGSLAGDSCAVGTAIEVRCVDMITLMTITNLDTIGLLKIDIEGGEQRLLADAPPWLKNVLMLLIELHGSYSLDDLRRDLYPMGFQVFPAGSMLGNRMTMALSPRLREVVDGAKTEPSVPSNASR